MVLLIKLAIKSKQNKYRKQLRPMWKQHEEKSNSVKTTQPKYLVIEPDIEVLVPAKMYFCTYLLQRLY